MSRKKKKGHIIGGGVAGYATAIALLQCDFDVHIWEKEEAPFLFSSSKNSAIARSYEADPPLSYLLKRSLLLMSEDSLSDKKMLEPVGLLINPMEYDYQEDIFFDNHSEFQSIELFKSQEKQITLPDGSEFSGILLPGNGILHIDKIQKYFRQEASQAHQLFYREIQQLEKQGDQIQKVIMISPDSKEYSISLRNGDIVVNALGSWAQVLAKKSEILSPNLLPHKRHMFLLENPKKWFFNSPVIWDEVHDFYIKYHYGDLLVSHCDEVVSEANDYEIDPHQIERLKEVLRHRFTFLRDCRVKDAWSCLRTFSLDNRPIIGFDPRIKNLFWCAGWGGRGMSMALGTVEIMEKLINKGHPREAKTEQENPFSAFRFL